jgi:hypothetical protein
MVDVRHLGAVTPDGRPVVLMTQRLYDDLLSFAGGKTSGLRVIVPDLAATAKSIAGEGTGSARYEATHGAVVIWLTETSSDGLLMSYPE